MRQRTKVKNNEAPAARPLSLAEVVNPLLHHDLSRFCVYLAFS